ncbi:MAG: MBOAT family protein [Planctomycetes bacterium]|nr:MBOAT family protein [Planctomycetota bacterium]
MLFSSAIFVWLFLPLVLLLYFSLRQELRNLLLMVASLLFYAWGETFLVVIMLFSITANWAFGLWLARAQPRGKGGRVVFWAAVLNLGLLVAFKYSDWLWSILSWLLHDCTGVLSQPLALLGSGLAPDSGLRALLLTREGAIRLPIGISFFTFQAFSYVLDVYRKDAEVEKSWFRVALYVSLFPQLIAGPIVRYKDVAEQIRERRVTLEGFAYGIRRFVLGLGKKMLLANIVAAPCDKIFGAAGIEGIPADQLTTPIAWLGIVLYALQIYFDFSAYSDMAIGLGHMFGFTFLENFLHPYISRSITEFWRRWHVSLSTWFRDYLYIPLGGNRISPARTYFNLVTVFFLCGLWHGASFNFVIWGLWHGLFLVLERAGLARWSEGWPALLRHAYVLLVVLIGWVFFRAADLAQSLHYLQTMFGLQGGGMVQVGELHIAASRIQRVVLYTDPEIWTAIVLGVVGSTPWLGRAVEWWKGLEGRGRGRLASVLEYASIGLLALVFLDCAMKLAAGSYSPFIYFRF